MYESIPLDEGLMILEEAFQKAKRIVEGYPDTKFTSDEYMKFHSCVYTLCYKPGDGNKAFLLERFKKSLEEIIISTVQPCLATKENELLLRELVLMWSNYKIMTRWLCRFFEYLDRYYSQFSGDTSLSQISVNCFCNLVLNTLHTRILAAAMSLIREQRHEKQIDPKLLQDISCLFMEFSENRSPSYYEHFEQAVLEETAAFYSQLSSQWVLHDSLTDYIQKVQWCIKKEKERADYYLHPKSVAKLIQAVQSQLLNLNVHKLIEKQQAESSQLDYQELLSKCAGLNIGEESSASTLGENLSALMANSAHIH